MCQQYVYKVMPAPEEYKNNLGNLLKHKRESLGLSKREMARRTGLPSHDTIRRLENGDYTHYPERETLEKIALNVFEVELRELEDLIAPSNLNPKLTVGSVLACCEQFSDVQDLNKVITVCSRRIAEILESSSTTE